MKNISYQFSTQTFKLSETPNIDKVGASDKPKKKADFKSNNFGKGYLKAF